MLGYAVAGLCLALALALGFAKWEHMRANSYAETITAKDATIAQDRVTMDGWKGSLAARDETIAAQSLSVKDLQAKVAAQKAASAARVAAQDRDNAASEVRLANMLHGPRPTGENVCTAACSLLRSPLPQ